MCYFINEYFMLQCIPPPGDLPKILEREKDFDEIDYDGRNSGLRRFYFHTSLKKEELEAFVISCIGSVEQPFLTVCYESDCLMYLAEMLKKLMYIFDFCVYGIRTVLKSPSNLSAYLPLLMVEIFVKWNRIHRNSEKLKKLRENVQTIVVIWLRNSHCINRKKCRNII